MPMWTLLAALGALGVALVSAANQGTPCPQACTCDEETLVVVCEEGNLDVVPITLNPSIQRLFMRYNHVKDLNAVLQFYGELQYVDLSHNLLVSIPVRTFETQRKLLHLRLDHNKISAVDSGTFHGLTSLTVLSLRGNFLMELNEGQFSTLRMLEELNLGQNRISKIDPRTFEGLSALRVLHLDDNQLVEVPSHSFTFLAGLAELRVGLNAFNTLKDDAFKSLSTLAVLDLSGAGLVNISSNAFRGLSVLRSLNLADNKLYAIPSAQLAKLPRLEELTIGQNPFLVLGAGAFQSLTNLRKLDISAAPYLASVERGALRDNTNLETLVLSSNKNLMAVREGALSGLPKLRHLSLRNNALTSVSEDMVAWSDLRSADLADNPLHCSCAVRWLPELLMRWKSTPTLCASPPPLRAQPLEELQPEKLGCARQLDSKQQAIIGIVCGVGVAAGALLALLLFKCRHRIQAALKDYRWNKRAISRKEQEYHKTFSEEDYMVRVENSLKPIPVTEL